MKQINYTGSSKLIARIIDLLNKKAPLPLNQQGEVDWGTDGKVLGTDGVGSTKWVTASSGGGNVDDVKVNGSSVVDANKVANVTVPTALSDLQDDSTHRVVTDTEKSTWSGKQDALTAGTNIQINGTTISATDTTYSDATQSIAGLMSTTDKTKLDGIANGAEVNVQSDWNEADSTSDAYIANKPTIPAAQIQSDWTQADNTQADYIKNKPTIPTVNDATLTITQNGSPLGTFTANASANVTIEVPGGGGSGGHTIEDTSGTDLPQEDNLQFVGVYTRDDSVNSRTEVNIVRQMTKAAMQALSSAEKEGFIDTTDEDEDYIPISAEDVKYRGTDVESALDSINAQISGGSRTVTTLVNEAVNIAASGSKTYAALTATALQAYDEIHFLANFGNVFVNGSATKEQMQNITAYTSPANGRLWFFASSLSASTEYSFRIRADSNGLQIINGSASLTLNNLRIDGVKYN